ncbi:MAG TPA: ribonuclease P protein component [Burkholderiaceae bacterium]|nr:ribonuclease P protein component [Burkholderiaceae bacterium]
MARVPVAGPPGAVAGSPAAAAPPSGSPGTPGARRGGSDRPVRLVGAHFVVGARRTTDAASPRLMMAVPKKQVPSSPVRNLIRRVVRESHRAWLAARPAGEPAPSVRVQLVKLPQDPAAPLAGPDGRALRPFARRPTDRALARLVRAEVDGLFGRLAPRRG